MAAISTGRRVHDEENTTHMKTTPSAMARALKAKAKPDSSSSCRRCSQPGGVSRSVRIEFVGHGRTLEDAR